MASTELRKTEVQGIRFAVSSFRGLPDWKGEGITHILAVRGGLDENDPTCLERTASLFPEAVVASFCANDVIDPCASFSPTEADVRQALEFTTTLSAGDFLLVQCTEGVSRSSALAFGALCQHWGTDFEIESFVDLKWICPCAQPNLRIVQFADEILKRGGRMLEAIQ